jgi:hypothetical protein
MLRARPYAIALWLFAIAGLGHLTRQLAQILEGGNEGAIGWWNLRAPSASSSRPRLSPTSVLDIPTIRPEHHGRPQSVRDDISESTSHPLECERVLVLERLEVIQHPVELRRRELRRPVVTLECLDLADQGAVRHQLAKHWLATAGVAAFSGWFSKRRPG